jgi:lactate permease
MVLAGYTQVYDPVNHSLALSALFAALPLVVLFVLLGVLKVKAWIASLAALAVCLVVAVFVYPMPIGQSLDVGVEGALFGLFPIMFIVVNAIWIYNMTVTTGHFDVLRRSFGKVSADQRIQAIIVAFCFGALMEALAGFGTPVAISSVMLIALGLQPMKAATVALVANTAPVAFGAMAIPITTLATVADVDVQDLGSMVGRQTGVLAVFIPLLLVFIIDGKRGLRQTWPVALVCGLTFGVTKFLVSNYMSLPLTDILAALLSAAAVVAFLRVWQPAPQENDDLLADGSGGVDALPTGGVGAKRPVPVPAGGVAVEAGSPPIPVIDTRSEVMTAYAPYVLITGIFAIAQIGPIKDLLAKATKLFQWPGLDVINPAGKPLGLMTFKLEIAGSAGTLLLVAGIITVAVLKLNAGQAIKTYGATLYQLRFAIITVMTVLALAYIMNASGQTSTIGLWMAGAGSAFALISPILGWLGVAVTGSDTSANALFGALQVQTAREVGLSEVLMAASNSSGGVLGKMVSPQTLAIAAAAVGLGGKEGEIFRKVIGYSLVLLAFMCVLIFLQSTAVLGWMVP